MNCGYHGNHNGSRFLENVHVVDVGELLLYVAVVLHNNFYTFSSIGRCSLYCYMVLKPKHVAVTE
jgi:hypothetical protein